MVLNNIQNISFGSGDGVLKPWPIEHPSEGKENTDHEFSLVPKERGSWVR